MKLLIAVLFLLASMMAIANFETITRNVTGYGASQNLAISNALVEAVSQVNGVTIDSNQVMESITSDNYFADHTTENSEFSVDVSSQQAVSRATGGYIDEYQVNSVSRSGSGYQADVTITFYRYNVPGLENNRRSMAILQFDASPQLARRYPQASGLITNHLIDFFTQSRRFTVLDRKNAAAYAAEKEVWLSADAGELESLRMGNVRGADYLVVGTVADIEVEDNSRTLRSTGEVIEDVTTHITARYRIVIPATRQIKWAASETIQITGANISTADFTRALSDSIGQAVLGNIYPARIAAIDGAQIVINQGGSTVTEGSSVEIFSLGDIIEDPYSGEPMGRVERLIGTAVISRVGSKVAYLEPIDGPLIGLSIGDIVRPVVATTEDVRPPRRQSSAVVKDIGVKLY